MVINIMYLYKRKNIQEKNMEVVEPDSKVTDQHCELKSASGISYRSLVTLIKAVFAFCSF